jgi:erythromycin esterase-like protein
MPNTIASSVVAAVRQAAHPLSGASGDYDPLLELIGEARFVLLGEASHGTHEFYRERARLTQQLITEKGFTAIAVEADWPDAYRVNRYVQGYGREAGSNEALAGFQRFPHWLWRNMVIVNFVDWLHAYNTTRPPHAAKTGFYGLDLYSLYTSIEAVLRYLDTVDPRAAQRARYRYSCFDRFGEDNQAYGYTASIDCNKSCEDEAVRQLMEVQRRGVAYARGEQPGAAEEFFAAEQNARVVRDAEAYYRTMFRDRVTAWNLRDRHMADTLEALVSHLQRQGEDPKVVVWAHNSHLGDARATAVGKEGELNVGQLVRERYGREAVLVGFSTYSGTVTAASAWDGPAERKPVQPALPESYEALFHAVGLPRFLLRLRDGGTVVQELRESRLERAIGVIYQSETERLSHYFVACLPEQFDALLHFDETRAVQPLDHITAGGTGEAPETFPSGQ